MIRLGDDLTLPGMETNGYDIHRTSWWLCLRPECLVAFELEGIDYACLRPVSRGDASKAACMICRRYLNGKRGRGDPVCTEHPREP